MLHERVVFRELFNPLLTDSIDAAIPHMTDTSLPCRFLKQYRGKVVLLDFWATWCHGCKEELHWFAEFSRKYKTQGLEVVGVSLDDDGWKVLKPFLAQTDIPYRIVLGNDSYLLDEERILMPSRKDEPPPDLRYFRQTPK